jgi:hypothetical protein
MIDISAQKEAERPCAQARSRPGSSSSASQAYIAIDAQGRIID